MQPASQDEVPVRIAHHHHFLSPRSQARPSIPHRPPSTLGFFSLYIFTITKDGHSTLMFKVKSLSIFDVVLDTVDDGVQDIRPPLSRLRQWLGGLCSRQQVPKLPVSVSAPGLRRLSGALNIQNRLNGFLCPSAITEGIVSMEHRPLSFVPSICSSGTTTNRT